jgi:hypothetical protein
LSAVSVKEKATEHPNELYITNENDSGYLARGIYALYKGKLIPGEN